MVLCGKKFSSYRFEFFLTIYVFPSFSFTEKEVSEYHMVLCVETVALRQYCQNGGVSMVVWGWCLVDGSVGKGVLGW